MDKRYRQSGYFSKDDSLYIIFQNDTLKHFRLNKQLFPQLKFRPLISENSGRKSRRYIDLSIPIFSLDQHIAYVQLNDLCPHCGSGYFIFLKKMNGKWKIVKQGMTWIN